MNANAPRPGMRYGVGFGQSMWLNEHFPTLAEAEAFFGKESIDSIWSTGRVFVVHLRC